MNLTEEMAIGNWVCKYVPGHWKDKFQRLKVDACIDVDHAARFEGSGARRGGGGGG